MQDELERVQFEEVYVWVDDIPLSRPRRNIHRDFSDGVMFAEVVHFFLPRLVELHNYIPANSVKQKRQNWDLLWRKVLPKLNIKTSDVNTEWVVQAKPGAIERLLFLMKAKLEETADGGNQNDCDLFPEGPTPPTSERQPSPAPSDSSLQRSPDPGPGPPPDDAERDCAPAPLADDRDDAQRAGGSGSSPCSLIPVKTAGAGFAMKQRSEAARVARAKATTRSRAAAASGHVAAAAAAPAELNRLRQLVIEQTEQITVLTARCCKLQQMLDLRDAQLKKL